MAIKNIIENENISLSNGGLAFHYAQSMGHPNRTWKPSLKGENGMVTVMKNGFCMILPQKALTKKGIIKKSWRAMIDKLAPDTVTLEEAVALANNGIELAVA